MPRMTFTALIWMATTLALCLGASARSGDSAPGTMKAVRIHEHGGRDKLVFEDVPIPTPRKGELLVRVHATGVNPVDWKIRSGMLGGKKLESPMTLGFDVSGVVESVGEGITKFKPGDEVFAYLALHRGGGYAQHAIVLETEAARKPKSLDHVRAAAVPLAALTAEQAFDLAGLQAGQTVLIHAGAGGVGHFAIQLAKARGARVIATGSESSLAFLRELGADEVVDYRAHRFEDVAKNVDVVLDSIGGETQERSFGVIRKGGYLVSIVQPPAPDKLRRNDIRGSVMLVRPDGDQLARLAHLIDDGRLKPHVSAKMPLADAAKAHEMSESGKTRGKIVLLPE